MKQIIAVDIGACLTKIAIAEPKRNVLEVTSLKHFSTPYQREDEFDEEAFFEKLFSLVPQNKIKAAQLAIGLPSPTTNFAFFEIPAMARSDLQRAIISEAQRTIRPTPTDTDILRYVVIKNPKSKEAHHTSVLAGAGIEADILRHYSLFEHRGIAPSFVGSSASSLMVYPLGYYSDLPENWCFVDIGYTNTTIVIFSGAIPTLVRTILFASRDFIRAISTDKKIEMEEAHRLFLKREAQEVVNTSWEYLVSEIRRSFAYYKEISAGKPIEGVYFTGGIFSVAPYIDVLKKNVGGKVELFNVSSVKKLSLEGINPEERSAANYFFANSLGLALSVEEKKQTLNFLPSSALKEKQTETVKSLIQQVLTFVAIGLIVILCLLLFGVIAAKSKQKFETKTFSEEEYNQVVAAEQDILALENEISAQNAFVEAKSKLNQSRRKVFMTIAKYIPTNAYLTTSEITKGSSSSGGGRGAQRGSRGSSSSSNEGESLKCEGWIQGSYEDTIEQLKLFIKKLSKSGVFSKVVLSEVPPLEDEVFQPFDSDFTVKARRPFKFELELKNE
ncbi:MAG: pilus assembly protein PilM [Candidatus Omnitrophica bacterium]|nr:pilus assembly protein PilM [Candidatus Omnitrophota bacterium]